MTSLLVNASEYHAAGNSEQKQDRALTAFLAQSSPGQVRTGVLSGLAVAAGQGTTHVISPGTSVAQLSALAGVSMVTVPVQETVDILGRNPVGSLGRVDTIYHNPDSGDIELGLGAPNAAPYPAVLPAGSEWIARIQWPPNATTSAQGVVTRRSATAALASGVPVIANRAARDSAYPAGSDVPVGTTIYRVDMGRTEWWTGTGWSGDSGWIDCALNSMWRNLPYGGVYDERLQARVINGVVHVRGMLERILGPFQGATQVATGGDIATLPVGARPSRSIIRPVTVSSPWGTMHLVIYPDGRIWGAYSTVTIPIAGTMYIAFSFPL